MSDPGDTCICPLCLREERGMSDFDPDWPHGHLYGGMPAEIIPKRAKGPAPIVALVSLGDQEKPFQFYEDGTCTSNVHRLINAPAPARKILLSQDVIERAAAAIYEAWPSSYAGARNALTVAGYPELLARALRAEAKVEELLERERIDE